MFEKHQKIKFKFLLVTFIISISLFAQPNQKEFKDLNTAYKNSKSDSSRVMILTKLGWHFRQHDKIKALKYCKKSIIEAKNSNYIEGMGFGNMATGNVYNYNFQYDSAVYFYKRAIPYFKSMKIEKLKNYRLGQLYYNYGKASVEIGLNEEAITLLIESSKFYLKSKNQEELPSIYISIANIYDTQKQYNQSLKYANIALQGTKRIKDTTEYCFVMNDLSSIYLSLHNQNNNLKYVKKAKSNFYKVAKILEKNPSFDKQGIIQPTVLCNIGDCLIREQKYDSAIYYFKKSNLLANKINYDWIIRYNFLYLGKVYLVRNQIDLADNYFKKAYTYVKDGDDDFKLKLYLSLVDLQVAKKNFSKALDFQKLYHDQYDKTLNIERNKAINEIQTRYETSKKELKINELKKDNANKKQQLFGTIILAVLSVLLALSIFIVYKFQKKIFKQKELLLQEENKKAILEKKIELSAKEKALLQNKLIEQENIRIQEEYELQKAIHILEEEKMLQNISFKSRELTANVMQLEKKNEMFIELKSQIQDNKKFDNPEKLLKSLNKLISESLNVEEDFQKFTKHFESVHPQFFEKVQEKSIQSLSSLDLKYCAYMKMKLSTKEIANLLNIESKSVRVAQYRIKKKLNLIESDDLKDVINKI